MTDKERVAAMQPARDALVDANKARWMGNFNKLKLYKQIYGDVRVLMDHELSYWIYTRLSEKSNNQLSKERIAL
jgi:hypothetical protein